MPKKGGKRLADIGADAPDGQKPEEGEDSKGEKDQIEPKVVAKTEESKAEEITPAEEPKAEEDAEKKPDPAPQPAQAPGPKAEAAAPKVQAPALSARQRQAQGAWERHQKTMDNHYLAVFQGVERDVASVEKGLQSNTAAAQDTQRNVAIAKRYLWEISESLKSVDTLVVPIVLQRDGQNF